MSLMAPIGRCFHCGHDPHEKQQSPTTEELLRKRIDDLQTQLAACAAGP